MSILFTSTVNNPADWSTVFCSKAAEIQSWRS